MNKHPLLIENERVEYLLETIVNTLTSNLALRQDLMQEARIHLWRLQSERPAQTLSWYLRGCRFRLQHYLATGRSVDSSKRREAQMEFFEADRNALESLEELGAHDHTFDEACVSDLIQTLAPQLKPGELKVLLCLADGLPTSLISKRLQLSSPTVTKYRRKIAKLALNVGVAAPSSSGRKWRWRTAARRKPVKSKDSLDQGKSERPFASIQVVTVGFGNDQLLWQNSLRTPALAVPPAA